MRGELVIHYCFWTLYLFCAIRPRLLVGFGRLCKGPWINGAFIRPELVDFLLVVWLLVGCLVVGWLFGCWLVVWLFGVLVQVGINLLPLLKGIG